MSIYLYIHVYIYINITSSRFFTVNSFLRAASTTPYHRLHNLFGVMQLVLVGTVPLATRHAHFRQLVVTALVANALAAAAFAVTAVAVIATTVDCRLHRS